MKLYDLQVNHLSEPLGFRMTGINFSWKVTEAKGKKQTAARIRIAVCPEALLAEEFSEGVLVDTGFDENASSLSYEVKIDLKARTRYYWDVSVKTDAGEEAVSEAVWFETGKIQEAWTGKWITCDNQIKRHPVFTKQIFPKGKVVNARLYICGLGLYEAYYVPEGKGKALTSPSWEDRKYRIGEEYLTPYSNDYNEWIQYQTFDITEQLQERGTLSVILGNGWYKARFGFTAFEDKGFYGDEWKLIAEIHIHYENGTEEIIGTGNDWDVYRSNISFSNLYDGEAVDDTLPDVMPEKAMITSAPKGELTERMSLPVTIHEQMKPIELIRTPAGEKVFDLGQEFAGIFTLKVREPAGSRIHIQTGEVLQNGNFYNENLRTAKSEFIYISDGTEKTIVPHFTYYGYRYVKVSGIPELKKEDLTGLALYSAIGQRGTIITGHNLVNQLVSNVRWGMKSNFVDVPTDCPQRDERMGWTGDTQVFSATATYLADTYAFYHKYLYDMGQEQKALHGKVPDVVPSCGVESTACVWGDAACIIPWNLYRFYGDVAILRDQYESMKAWVDYIADIDGTTHNWRHVFHYGDWLALDNPNNGTDQVLGGTDEEFIANVYYAASAKIVAEAAALLGKKEDEKKYRTLAGEQFDTVRYEYYSASGRCCIKTQTALLLTLKYGLSKNIGLTRDMLRKLFADNDDKLKTGFVGTPLLGNILSEYGYPDLAYKLLLNEEYPGWLHEIKLGATTVWERWNSILEDGSISSTGMNSLNHYSYGSIVEWMFRYVVGIDQAEGDAGYKKVLFHPELNWALRKVSGAYNSPAGLYTLNWELPDPKHVIIRVSVPFDCEAVLKFPESDRADEVLCTGEYEYRYELIRSMKKVYTLDTPIREILGDKEAADRIRDMVPFESIPAQYRDMTLTEMNEKFGNRIPAEMMQEIEKRLAEY